MPTLESVYGTQVTLTIGLASLASDTNLLAGRESTVVDNTSGKAVDFDLAGQITVGTSPTTARRIEVWAFGAIAATPAYPSPLTGADSNRTIIAALKGYTLRQVALLDTLATSNQAYGFGPIRLSSLFGGIPSYFGVFVVHNTGVNLHATSGNHFITARPIKYEQV